MRKNNFRILLDKIKENIRGIPLWVWMAVIAFTLFFTVVSALRHYTFHTVPDLGYLEAPLWNTARGRFFYDPNAIGGSTFGKHNHIFLILIVPVYALFPYTTTLFFLQSLAIAAGAIPVYLLAKHILRKKPFPAVFTIAYLLYPALWHVSLEEVHPEAFLIPLLLFTLYFMQTEKWKLYYTFLLLSLSVKEDVPLLTIMLGLYLILKKRPRHGIITVALSSFWLWFSLFIFIPSFAKGEFSFIEERYGHLGSSLFEVAKSIIMHPIRSLSASYGSWGIRLKYIYSFLQPLLFLPLMAPELYPVSYTHLTLPTKRIV